MNENMNLSKGTQPDAAENKPAVEENTNNPISHDSNEYHHALSNRRIRRWLKVFRTELKELRKNVKQLGENIQILGRDYPLCVKIVKECQEETAKTLNHELERHTLNPAVLTVSALADELLRLNDIAQASEQHTGSNPELKALKDELQISSSIASDKLAYLDIVRIAPSKNDKFEPEMHIACGSVHTNNKNLHGAIGELLTTGIIYRNKVLQQARVSLFCYWENQKPKHKKVKGEKS